MYLDRTAINGLFARTRIVAAEVVSAILYTVNLQRRDEKEGLGSNALPCIKNNLLRAWWNHCATCKQTIYTKVYVLYCTEDLSTR